MFGKISVVIADGSVQDAYVAKAKSVKIGDLNVESSYILVMPDPKAPLLVGQNVINQLGKVTIDNNNNKIIFEKNTNIQHSKLLQLRELKYIPCSVSKINDISSLKNIIGNDEIRILSVTQEYNVPPPQKAITNLIADITIRYFDNEDYDIALFLKKKIEKDSKYNNLDVNIQNMLPFFNYKAIHGLIEIWIK